MFSAFIDDSGSHEQSQIMTLAGLVSTTEDWKRFSDDWHKELTSNKPIEYYKSYEAESLSRCFDGFTRHEADTKTEAFTDIVVRHMLYGAVSAIRWSDYIEIIQGHAPKPKGRLHNYLKHPYYFCFHDLAAIIGQQQIEEGWFNKEVDFVFDRQGKFGTRCIHQYEEFKTKFTEPLQSVMGRATPGDDKKDLPLQAADLVAWQVRNGYLTTKETATRSHTKLAESSEILYHAFNRHELKQFIAKLNVS